MQEVCALSGGSSVGGRLGRLWNGCVGAVQSTLLVVVSVGCCSGDAVRHARPGSVVAAVSEHVTAGDLPFHLEALSDGQVTVVTWPKPEPTRFKIAHSDWEKFLELVEQVEFWDLPPNVGRNVFGASRSRLRIAVGGRSNTITLRDPHVEFEESPESHEHAQRAFRVWAIITGWVEQFVSEPKRRMPN